MRQGERGISLYIPLCAAATRNFCSYHQTIIPYTRPTLTCNRCAATSSSSSPSSAPSSWLFSTASLNAPVVVYVCVFKGMADRTFIFYSKALEKRRCAFECDRQCQSISIDRLRDDTTITKSNLDNPDARIQHPPNLNKHHPQPTYVCTCMYAPSKKSRPDCSLPNSDLVGCGCGGGDAMAGRSLLRLFCGVVVVGIVCLPVLWGDGWVGWLNDWKTQASADRF